MTGDSDTNWFIAGMAFAFLISYGAYKVAQHPTGNPDDGVVAPASSTVPGSVTMWSPSPVVAIPTCPPGHAALTHDDLLLKFNEERITAHIPEMLSNHLLDDYAKVRVAEIAANGSYEASNPHQTKYKDVFYWGHSLGRSSEGNKIATYSEEVIGHQEDSCSAIAGFMDSPSHRAGILDPKADVLGVATLKGYVVYEIGTMR